MASTAPDHRPARYIETDADGNETVVYRASDLGMCERAIVATARGNPPAPRPAWFQEILDEGALCEGQIADKWDTQTGIPTVNDQLEVELEVGEIDGRRVIIRGHIDGEAEYVSNHTNHTLSNGGHGVHQWELRGREYKKFRESTWSKFLTQGVECQPNYPWQVSIYMHAREYHELEFVGGRIAGYRDDNGKLHDKPYDGDVPPPQKDWRLPVIDEVECKLLTQPPIPLKDILKRVFRIERLINQGFDATEVPCNKSKYPCPFYVIHDEDDSAEYTFAKDVAVGKLFRDFSAADAKLAKLRAAVRDAEKAAKELTAQVRERVSAEGPDAAEAKRLIYGNVTITRKRYHSPEKTIRAYDVDSFSAKKGDD